MDFPHGNGFVRGGMMLLCSVSRSFFASGSVSSGDGLACTGQFLDPGGHRLESLIERFVLSNHLQGYCCSYLVGLVGVGCHVL